MHIQVKRINDKVIQYLNKGVIVLDTETTGFSKINDRIIEFAGVKYIDGKLADSVSIMMNPCRSIHKSCRWIPLNLFRGGKRLIPPFY